MRRLHWLLAKLAFFALFVALPALLVFGLWKGTFFGSTALWYVCILGGPCCALWAVLRDWKAYPDAK